jgi:hypothetical protein
MGSSPQPTAGSGLGKVVPSVGTTGPFAWAIPPHGCADLPARHAGAGRGHRGGHGEAAAAGAAEGQGGRGSGHGAAIGHATGTRPETRFLKIT